MIPRPKGCGYYELNIYQLPRALARGSKASFSSWIKSSNIKVAIAKLFCEELNVELKHKRSRSRD